ncbi:MAG: response regulator [Nitrospirae bacterium]|nr:response regulator [Nitrospirota bacterium]
MTGQILVIDDEPVIRETLKTFLEDTYHILFARSAREGLKMLSEDLGLVFLDYKLPDATGIEVLLQIRKSYPSLPVIFMTAYGNEDVCRDAFVLGARDYIKKTFFNRRGYTRKS